MHPDDPESLDLNPQNMPVKPFAPGEKNILLLNPGEDALAVLANLLRIVAGVLTSGPSQARDVVRVFLLAWRELFPLHTTPAVILGPVGFQLEEGEIRENPNPLGDRNAQIAELIAALENNEAARREEWTLRENLAAELEAAQVTCENKSARIRELEATAASLKKDLEESQKNNRILQQNNAQIGRTAFEEGYAQGERKGRNRRRQLVSRAEELEAQLRHEKTSTRAFREIASAIPTLWDQFDNANQERNFAQRRKIRKLRRKLSAAKKAGSLWARTARSPGAITRSTR